jgi:ferredoxin
MPTIEIDGERVEVGDGASVLDAARRAGIEIPTLCHEDGAPAQASCMVCVVKAKRTGQMVPACAQPAVDGDAYESDTAEVAEARRAALGLLLAAHVGDCDAPCEGACPAGLDVPAMLRAVAAGRPDEAARIVRRDLPLAGVVARLCEAPCERACRRRQADGTVAIRRVARYAADFDGSAGIAPEAEPTGRRVAVVGAGAAGLSAAAELARRGHACTLFEAEPQPGGALRAAHADRLPSPVLEAEMGAVLAGAQLRTATRVGADVPVSRLRSEFDAVVLAVGPLSPHAAAQLGVEVTHRGIRADPHTLATSEYGVYAAGACVAPDRKLVRAVADGKTAAAAIDQQLRGEEVVGRPRRFSVHMGRLGAGEMEQFLAAAGEAPPADANATEALHETEARRQAARCLHCDCRKADACRLRDLAEALGARAERRGVARPPFRQDRSHPRVLYEPGKCIRCGRCVRITAEAGEPYGLTFLGRGYDVRVAVPMGRPLSEGLTHTAERCVEACPTGALAFRDAPAD